MNKIYQEIAKLSSFFKEISYGLTKNKTDVEEAVQELMLYFLERPELIKKIYDSDGEKGIKRFGAVILRRALTSTRSPFYYKYRKYYTHLDSKAMNATYDLTNSESTVCSKKHLYNIPEEINVNIKFQKLDKIDVALGDLYWYDRKVFELYYYEGNTLDSLAKKTGISRNSLFTTIDKVRTYLKITLNE
jgi:DNA-directed RNA polymerase specialized sigma24 family protein